MLQFPNVQCLMIRNNNYASYSNTFRIATTMRAQTLSNSTRFKDVIGASIRPIHRIDSMNTSASYNLGLQQTGEPKHCHSSVSSGTIYMQHTSVWVFLGNLNPEIEVVSIRGVARNPKYVYIYIYIIHAKGPCES